MKQKMLAFLVLSVISSASMAVPVNSMLERFKAKAASGSTQFVIIMNSLANSSSVDVTKTDLKVNYYDGAGNHPPCWTEYKIAYHADPNVAGAGGDNACGVGASNPAAIVKVDILPIKSALGVLYQDAQGVIIDPTKFFTIVGVQQATPPVFNPDGTLKKVGTLKITQQAFGERS